MIENIIKYFTRYFSNLKNGNEQHNTAKLEISLGDSGKYALIYNGFEINYRHQRIDGISDSLEFDTLEEAKHICELYNTGRSELNEKSPDYNYRFVLYDIESAIESVDLYLSDQKTYDDEVSHAKQFIGKYFYDKDNHNYFYIKDIMTHYGCFDYLYGTNIGLRTFNVGSDIFYSENFKFVSTGWFERFNSFTEISQKDFNEKRSFLQNYVTH